MATIPAMVPGARLTMVSHRLRRQAQVRDPEVQLGMGQGAAALDLGLLFEAAGSCVDGLRRCDGDVRQYARTVRLGGCLARRCSSWKRSILNALRYKRSVLRISAADGMAGRSMR